MDFPAVVFPTGRLKAQGYVPLDVSEDFAAGKSPRNDVEAFIQAQWNPNTYDNASIGLQLIGRRLNEEKLLGVLRVVEDALRHFQSKP